MRHNWFIIAVEVLAGGLLAALLLTLTLRALVGLGV